MAFSLLSVPEACESPIDFALPDQWLSPYSLYQKNAEFGLISRSVGAVGADLAMCSTALGQKVGCYATCGTELAYGAMPRAGRS
eukprot:525739-Rhodomonas_salina.1